MCIKITSKDCCLQKQAACWSQALIPACHWNGFDFITRSFSAMTVQPLVNCNSWWTGNCCAQQTLISTYATSASLRKSNTGSRSTVPFLLNINFPGNISPCSRKAHGIFLQPDLQRVSGTPAMNIVGSAGKWNKTHRAALITSRCLFWCLFSLL